ncbi:hypothetical protein [Bacterioplanoides pacificum]|uniref:Uncharacterized protein n=1 Tax=Bacterioplanoides pacificum TaxID=1171596 RepID=A0ABV7VP92_9GAMM
MLNIVAIASSDMQTILILVNEIKNYSRLIAKKWQKPQKVPDLLIYCAAAQHKKAAVMRL